MASNPYLTALNKAFQLGNQFLNGLDDIPVGSGHSYDELKAMWDWQLPAEGKAPEQVIDELDTAARPGLQHNQSGRFFAWVIGGTHPAALAADWLTSVWDQNAGMFTVSPAAAVAEEVAGHWLKQLLNIPQQASFAFVTGCQMAHFTCLAAARNALLHRLDWDVEARGLAGAPRIRVLCSDQKHATVDRALRLLGLGTECLSLIPSDGQARIRPEALEALLKEGAQPPTVMVLQAGDVNTGAYDDFKTIIPMAHAYNCWVHIDGAFGLWAAASSSYRHLTEGAELADSWATDGHKWLNVPYDSGYAFVAHPEPHARSMGQLASYLVHSQQARDQLTWNPEFSRRARGFATWAAIRELGAVGIEELIDRTCRHARSIVEGIGALPHTEIVTRPVINQGLIRFMDPAGGNADDLHDRFTEKIIQRINASGEAFFQATTYKGRRCMRISVSGWRTDERDVERTIDALRKALVEVGSIAEGLGG